MVRVIGHIDLDYFYAQVEELEDPSLKSRPVLVCVFSGRTEDSGVVATANYRAREFGVGSGMPIALAKRKLQGKDPALVRMSRPKYEQVSDQVMNLVSGNVDVLEQTGIDEAFFDITKASAGNFAEAGRIATRIKESILTKERLTCSIGIGQSKVVAKVASDFKKPDGLTTVIPESTESFLGALPVTKMYGVGPKTTRLLGGIGINTIAELSRAPPQSLQTALGRRLSQYLLLASKGQDTEPVSPSRNPTQLSRIITLKANTADPSLAFSQLTEALRDLHQRLNSRGATFRTISAIAILTDLSIKTKSKTLESPTSDMTMVTESTRTLLEDLAKSSGKEFRRVGVRLSDLANSRDQTSLIQFTGEDRESGP